MKSMLKLTNISLILINIHKQRNINIKVPYTILKCWITTPISSNQHTQYRGSVRYAVGESSSFVTPIFAHS